MAEEKKSLRSGIQKTRVKAILPDFETPIPVGLEYLSKEIKGFTSTSLEEFLALFFNTFYEYKSKNIGPFLTSAENEFSVEELLELLKDTERKVVTRHSPKSHLIPYLLPANAPEPNYLLLNIPGNSRQRKLVEAQKYVEKYHWYSLSRGLSGQDSKSSSHGEKFKFEVAFGLGEEVKPLEEWKAWIDSSAVNKITELETIEWERNGVPVEAVAALAKEMDVSSEWISKIIGLSDYQFKAGLNVEVYLNEVQTPRFITVARLIGMVAKLVEDFGDKETEFNPAKWLAKWLDSPVPALGEKTPASFMDTVTGQKLVVSVFRQIENGTYA